MKLLFKIYKILPKRLRWAISRAGNDKFLVGVLAIIERKGKYLLIKSSYGKNWTLPSGWLKKNESLEDCVRREIKEEIDIDIKFVKILFTESRIKNHVPVIDVVFLCDTAAQQIKKDGKEISEVKYFSPDKFPEDFSEYHKKYLVRYTKRNVK